MNTKTQNTKTQNTKTQNIKTQMTRTQKIDTQKQKPRSRLAKEKIEMKSHLKSKDKAKDNAKSESQCHVGARDRVPAKAESETSSVRSGASVLAATSQAKVNLAAEFSASVLSSMSEANDSVASRSAASVTAATPSVPNLSTATLSSLALSELNRSELNRSELNLSTLANSLLNLSGLNLAAADLSTSSPSAQTRSVGEPVGVSLESSSDWLRELGDEFSQPYMKDLQSFLEAELNSSQSIYPKPSEWFAAFSHTSFARARVVILGQDPYHGAGQAHGLSFSVRPGVPLPPSLINIFKELKNDLGLDRPTHGHLEFWASQGVLLLNSVLTVREAEAASHQGRGWERFTDRVIHVLAERRERLVFVLWGAYAQKKGAFIDRTRHLVLESPHPSPLSASRGFLGSKPFSKINRYLESLGGPPIDWALPPSTHNS